MEIKLRVCAPLMASLDITYRCNLRCSMCNVWKIARREKELDLEGWKDVINQLIQAFSIRFFRLVGGEPFLRSDFTDIVHYLKARGCSLTIVSNGTLISKKMADFLVSEHVDRIRISINGLQKIDDFYRGKGAFTKTMKGIRALVQEKKRQSVHAPRIEIHPFVSKVNCEEIYKLLRLSRQLKADFRFHWMRGTLEGAIAGKVSRLQDPGFPEDSQKLSIMSLKKRRTLKRGFPYRYLSENNFCITLERSKICQYCVIVREPPIIF